MLFGYFILFFFVSSLRDTFFATSKGDLCERESAHNTHTRARKEEEEEEESRKRLSFRVVVVVVVVV